MMFGGMYFLGRGDDTIGNALLNESSRLAREAVDRRSVISDTGPVNVCVQCHHPRRHREGGPGALERTTTPAGTRGDDDE
jgi:hypothetical protein